MLLMLGVADSNQLVKVSFIYCSITIVTKTFHGLKQKSDIDKPMCI